MRTGRRGSAGAIRRWRARWQLRHGTLVPADRDQRRDVYVLDRLTQRVTLESPPLEGIAAADRSHPAISGDGRYVAYEAGDRVLLHDRDRDATREVDEGRQPAISRDGSTLAFTSDTSVMSSSTMGERTREHVGEGGAVSLLQRRRPLRRVQRQPDDLRSRSQPEDDRAHRSGLESFDQR
jgi:Tol biopolymer transport system component